MSTTAQTQKPKADQPKPRSDPPKKPTLKIGPFQGGIGVAVWENEAQTENGPRKFRSISINPRRFFDKKTGEWKDAGSYRPGDLSALILALEKAREHCLSVPLPGETAEDDRMAGMAEGEIPY